MSAISAWPILAGSVECVLGTGSSGSPHPDAGQRLAPRSAVRQHSRVNEIRSAAASHPAASSPDAGPHALRVVGDLADRPFTRSRLVDFEGELWLHKRFRIPGVPKALQTSLAGALMRFEVSNCRRFEGLPGTVARTRPVDRTSFLREWVEGTDLRSLKRRGGRVPDAFFDDLRGILDAIHARGVAYNDLEKKDNVLLTRDGKPVLIDYQICVSRYRGPGAWLRAVSGRVVSELQRQDLRYLYKMKRRHRPDLLTSEEEGIGRERSRAAQIYYPLWRLLHGIKRWLIPKGAAAFGADERRPSC